MRAGVVLRLRDGRGLHSLPGRYVLWPPDCGALIDRLCDRGGPRPIPSVRRAAIPAHDRIRRWQARAVLLCELRRLRRLLPRAVRPDVVRPVSPQHPAVPDGLVGHESERVSMQNRCALHSPVRPHRCRWLGLTGRSSASPVLAASQATTIHNSRLGRCHAILRGPRPGLRCKHRNIRERALLSVCRSARNVRERRRRFRVVLRWIDARRYAR